MPNEFIIKNGYISKGDSIVEGGLTATTLHRDHTVSIQFAWANFTGQYMVGSIAQGMIYNRVLSSSEVLQNFNSTKSRFGL